MIFLAMSNLYFFHLSKGRHVDFIETLHPVLVFDFANVFLGRAAATKGGEYLAEEPELDF
jgi:hypothetical protein